MSGIANIFLSILGIVGGWAANRYFSVPIWIFGLTGLGIFVISCLIYFNSRYVTSQPNEWLLLIENGKLIKAGVGLTVYQGMTQTVVKFPSTIKKISFSAEQVTKEIQGLKILGFVIWSVFRDAEGPFKCYKYMQGGNADSNIKELVESIIRHQVANHSLKEVMTNRSLLRDKVRTEIQEQLSGWGVWLETIEITEVRICSYTLFEELQSEFRQDTHLKSEQIRLDTNRQVQENNCHSQLEIAKSKSLNETERLNYSITQGLKRKEQEFKIQEKELNMQMKKIEQQKVLDLKKIEKEQSLALERLNKENEIRRLKEDREIDSMKEQLKLEEEMTPLNMQKHLIDTTKAIYSRFPIKELRVNNFCGPEHSGMGSMLPGLGALMEESQKLAEASK